MTELYTDPIRRAGRQFEKYITSIQPQLNPNANISRIAQSMRQDLEWQGVRVPRTFKNSFSQIDSSGTGDTVLLTGETNMCYLITDTSFYHSGTGTATFRLEIDSGSSFGTTTRISSTDSNAKETQGQQLILKSTDRLVCNVTSAVGSSTIDCAVMYEVLGFGDVYG